ncbi:MAG: adenylosuccinate synthase [Bacteroidia bacterium]
MKADVLLGLQWGDEGKGKIVDVITPEYDIIARFQGGPNAGHSLAFDGTKVVLNTIPSGIFREHAMNIIGNGVVIDPVTLQREINNLLQLGVPVYDRLYISRKAHLIMPTHPILDAAYEKAKGEDKIGSTLKGIGPTYADKIGRSGLRVGNLIGAGFKSAYAQARAKHLETLKLLQYEDPELEAKEARWMEAIDFLSQFKTIDSEVVINQALREGKKVLAEGAQGTLLDIDFGSYPFVTSSNTITAGACTGLGLAPQRIGEVYGIFKAYCTRVGSGPFPTELHGTAGEELRKLGNEFGATTGRPRRCGWIDLPALKYAIMLNGATQLIMTKSDVLSGFKEIGVCTHYKTPEGLTDTLPFDLADAEPVFEMLPGWQQDLTGMSSADQLPSELQNYIAFLEQKLEVPIKVVSVGPDRTQTLFRS